MKRKLFSVLLAVAFILQGVAMTAFADTTPPTQVSVPINVEVSKTAQNKWSHSESAKGSGTFTFDFRAVMDTTNIKTAITKWYDWSLEHLKTYSNGDDVIYQDLVDNHLNKTAVKGEFEVTVTYPSSFNVDGAYITGGSMYGFNDAAKTIFHEVSRNVTVNGSESVLTIKIATNAAGDLTKDLTVKDLHDNADAYFPAFTFTVNGVSLSGVGTYTVTGAFKGKTTFAVDGTGTEYKVDYNGIENSDNKLSAVIKITKPSSGGGVTPSNGSNPVFLINGTEYTTGSAGTGTVKTVSDIVSPVRDGYTFSGWYLDSELKQPADPNTPVTSTTRLYGHWISNTFETEDHFAYIMGYPDGTVRPENNITREEVATILYRLLKADAREAIYTTDNNFPDVSADRWSNHCISTMANGAYVLGYEDGTFGPAKSITRAEFATMVVRYAKGVVTAEAGALSDISGHWGENYILTAVGEGWIAGYEDGTFKPDKYITRAETMTILNRMLARKVDATGIHADAKIWSDNSASGWYYYEVEEATNSHDYTRKSDGLTENWDSIREGILGETI